MIINIRGTSGSGKSTVMRKIMEALIARDGQPEKQYVDGRKQPLRYFFNGLLYVLGHYESPCGGCDTIGSARAVYDLIQQMESGPANAQIILCEGLLLSEDVKWSSQMKDLRVFYLTTPVELCLSQIENRRKEAGNEKPLNPANTTNRVATIERSRLKLIEAGIPCRRCTADQAPGLILSLIRLHADLRRRHGSGTKLADDKDGR